MQCRERRIEQSARWCEDRSSAIWTSADGQNGVFQSDTVVLGEDGVQSQS